MIKFSAHNRESERPVLGIGLSRENCDRLLDGQPIAFTTEEMAGLPSMEVFIMAGETEGDMARDMLQSGAVTIDNIRDDRRLADPHIRPADTKGAN